MIKYTNKYKDSSFDIAKCHESAESGSAHAQYQLGQCYEEGIGVERNLAKAFKLYWLASDNCRPAKERLNKDSYQGKLAKWLKKAVNGNLLSDSDLAKAICSYQHGWGVDCDMTAAVEWWRRAADMGNAYAADQIGDSYYCGDGGMPKDAEMAFEYYLKAADGGYAGAYFTLGLCYSNSTGVNRDDEKAFYWFTKAATNGNENTGYYGHTGAMRCLGDCYANGDGVRENAKQTAKWYAKTDEQKQSV